MKLCNNHEACKHWRGTSEQRACSRTTLAPEWGKEVKNAISVFQNQDFSKSNGRVIHLVSMSNESLKSNDENTSAEALYHELKAHIDINTGDADVDHELYGKDDEGLYLDRPNLDPLGNQIPDENGNNTRVVVRQNSPAGQFMIQLYYYLWSIKLKGQLEREQKMDIAK